MDTSEEEYDEEKIASLVEEMEELNAQHRKFQTDIQSLDLNQVPSSEKYQDDWNLMHFLTAKGFFSSEKRASILERQALILLRSFGFKKTASDFWESVSSYWERI